MASTDNCDVVFLGKSLECLYAAKYLHDANISFSILDLNINQSCKLLFNSEKHPLTLELTNMLNCERTVLNNESNCIVGATKLIPFRARFIRSPWKFYETLDVNDVLRKIRSLSDSISFSPNIFDNSFGNIEVNLDQVSVEEFLRKNCWTKFGYSVLSAVLTDFLKASLDQVSLLWFTVCVKSSGGIDGIFPSHDSLYEISSLIDEISRNFPENSIRKLKSADGIRSISENADGTSVNLEDGKTITAKYLISCVPFQILTRFNLKNSSLSRFSRIFLDHLIIQPRMELSFLVGSSRSGDLKYASISVYSNNRNLTWIPITGTSRIITSIVGEKCYKVEALRKSPNFTKYLEYYSAKLPFQTSVESYTDVITNENYPPPKLLSSELTTLSQFHFTRIFVVDSLFTPCYQNHLEGKLALMLGYLSKILPNFGVQPPELPVYSVKLEEKSLSWSDRLRAEYIFDHLPSLKQVTYGFGIYFAMCFYYAFANEMYEIISLLYVYYRFDSARGKLFLPKSSRFQKFTDFFQVTPVVKGVTSGAQNYFYIPGTKRKDAKKSNEKTPSNSAGRTFEDNDSIWN